MSAQTPKLIEVSFIGQYAGFASRLLAGILDAIILSVIIFSTNWFVSISVRILQIREGMESLLIEFPLLQQIMAFIFSPAVHSLLTLAFIIAYYLFFWTVAGQTIGKAIMGIRIVSQRGERVKLYQAILRYFGYYLSAIPFGLGFFWILIDDRRLGWHDRLANTCVIYVWEARPDERFLSAAISQLEGQRNALRSLLRMRTPDQLPAGLTEWKSSSPANDLRTERTPGIQEPPAPEKPELSSPDSF